MMGATRTNIMLKDRCFNRRLQDSHSCTTDKLRLPYTTEPRDDGPNQGGTMSASKIVLHEHI